MKQSLINKFFQKKSQLTTENPFYQKIISDLFLWFTKNDQVKHDLTTNIIFTKSKKVISHIVAREYIIAAGLEEINYFIKKFTNLEIKFLCHDGEKILPNQIILELVGELKEILAYERTILNILQRMCGIATETKNIIEKNKREKPFIAATRKTQWGILDKKAVTLGGGITHRLDLSDNILVKDNHLMLISASDALNKILEQTENNLIEIEVEDEKTLLKLITIFSTKNTNNTLAILLDNFNPEKIKKILTKNKFPENIIFEASGGITKENIDKYFNTGVDIISLGSLTHSSKAADISLDIIV